MPGSPLHLAEVGATVLADSQGAAMVGTVVRTGAAAACLVGALVVGQGSATADQGCTGATASTAAQAPGPFGALVVAPTAMFVDSFGQDVIRPEATAPHDDCPQPAGAP